MNSGSLRFCIGSAVLALVVCCVDVFCPTFVVIAVFCPMFTDGFAICGPPFDADSTKDFFVVVVGLRKAADNITVGK